MQLHFIGRHIEVTDALKTHTAEKFKPLEKRFSHITQVNIVLHVEHAMQIAEATLHVNGVEIHASAEDQDMYKAIDILADKLISQLTKYKEKLIKSHR